MRPPMIDANGKRFKVGYLVHTRPVMNMKSKPFTVIRQTKKGNIVIKRGGFEMIVKPRQLHKLSIEDMI